MNKEFSNKQEFDRRIELETNTKFIDRFDQEFGDVVILQHLSTQEKLMMKEKVFVDKNSFFEELLRTQNRHIFNHPNLMRFVDYSVLSKEDQTGQTFKIRLFFEYLQQNLKGNLEEKRIKGEDFSIEEITHMVFDLIAAGAYLQEKGVNHGDISPRLIMRTKDGHFVIGDKLKNRTKHPQNLIDRFIKSEELYLSPELFRCIKTRNSEGLDKMDYFRSDLFITGLCILESGIMSKVTDIFKLHNNSVDKDMLANLMNRFHRRYQDNPLVCSIVEKMLEVDETKRPDFITLKYSLPFYEEVLLFFRNQHQKGKQLGINLTENKQKDSISISIDKQTGQNKTIQRELSDLAVKKESEIANINKNTLVDQKQRPEQTFINNHQIIQSYFNNKDPKNRPEDRLENKQRELFFENANFSKQNTINRNQNLFNKGQQSSLSKLAPLKPNGHSQFFHSVNHNPQNKTNLNIDERTQNSNNNQLHIANSSDSHYPNRQTTQFTNQKIIINKEIKSDLYEMDYSNSELTKNGGFIENTNILDHRKLDQKYTASDNKNNSSMQIQFQNNHVIKGSSLNQVQKIKQNEFSIPTNEQISEKNQEIRCSKDKYKNNSKGVTINQVSTQIQKTNSNNREQKDSKFKIF